MTGFLERLHLTELAEEHEDVLIQEGEILDLMVPMKLMNDVLE